MWFAELFQVGVYKRSQGRIARQATFAVLAITIAMGAYRLFTTFGTLMPKAYAYGLSGFVLMAGLWISFRAVNMPRFADFLIAVEAEMNKVSWPSRGELMRSAAVVIFVIFFLSLILFSFDIFWGLLFEWMGIIKSSS